MQFERLSGAQFSNFVNVFPVIACVNVIDVNLFIF